MQPTAKILTCTPTTVGVLSGLKVKQTYEFAVFASLAIILSLIQLSLLLALHYQELHTKSKGKSYHFIYLDKQ